MTSEAKELLVYKFETPRGQTQYKKRMTMVESHFTYNKYTLKDRKYPFNRSGKYKMQQTLMATAQNIEKIHNIELNEQTNNKTIINIT